VYKFTIGLVVTSTRQEKEDRVKGKVALESDSIPWSVISITVLLEV
jgi:hypothetical protein